MSTVIGDAHREFGVKPAKSDGGLLPRRWAALRRATACGYVLAVVLAGGCAAEGGADPRTPTVPETSDRTGTPDPECEEESPAIAPPATHPDVWVGVRWLDNQDGYEVVRVDGADPVSIFRFEFQGAPDPSLPEDVAVDPATATVLFAICCEAGGTVLAVDDPDHELSDQGRRVDLLSGGGLMVRADAAGGVGIRPEFPDTAHETVLERAQAVDVAITADARVVALIDPTRVTDLGPAAAEPGVSVLRRDADCGWTGEHVDIDASRYCSVVALGQGRVGLLAAAAGWRATSPEPCEGNSLDVLDLSTGAVDHGVLTFPTALAHLSSDGSGGYLIATGVDGRVWWRTLDGAGGQLPGTAYVAADW